MKRRPRPFIPPWEKPSRVICLILAITAAFWLTINMPASSRMRASDAVQTKVLPSRSTEQLSEKPLAAPKQDNLSLATKQQSALSVKEPDTLAPERMRPSTKASSTASVSTSPMDKILAKLKSFARLFTIVGVAAFLGALMEARRWHMALAWMMGKLTRMARLPAIVGFAMPTALFSNAAANTILVTNHDEGRIRTSALIAGGMANSYLAFVSHSIRVMYPVVGAIGLPGILYFSFQFSGGFLVILAVFLWNRWYISRHETPQGTNDMPAPSQDDAPLPWPNALKKAAIRSLSLLFRMVYITIPLMLGVEWLLKSGLIDFWNQYIPAQVSRFFPVELVSVVAAQLGGLIQSSAVAANLRAEGLINNTQILLAMLVGSAVGNPFRTFRRNLPSALALFPAPIALTIVFTMQFARFITTLVGITGVIAFMYYVLNV